MRRRVIFGIVAAVMVVGLAAIASQDETGNGAPSGQHKNINIIGVNNEKNENYTGGNGSALFVKRTGTTTFYVHGGSSFQILDHDGTDGKVGTGLNDPGIVFPYDETTGEWLVSIYVRLLGPKGSEVNWTSYYYDTTGATYVLWDQFTLTKNRPAKFTEKTGSLLADGYQDMMWELDPVTKFRICQMRIFVDEVDG